MSKKRPYRLGKRQASVDQTRRRILLAAVTEYSRNGIDETTMVAVAKRADVASGTVLYHYPEPELLAEAVVDMWIEEADLPEPAIVTGDLSIQERSDLLADTLLDMYDRDHPAAPIYLKDPQHPAMRKLLGYWDDRLSHVVDAALGTHMKETDRPVIAAIIGGQFLASLSRHGISENELSSTVSRLIAAWLTSQPTEPNG